MATVVSMLVTVGADVGGLERDMSRAERAVSRSAQSMVRSVSQIVLALVFRPVVSPA